jgi:adenine-specific DNA methylase
MTKRLIEFDLPLADISEESAREKNIRHGHPSTLHIWWARWLLTSSRIAAFVILVANRSEAVKLPLLKKPCILDAVGALVVSQRSKVRING